MFITCKNRQECKCLWHLKTINNMSLLDMKKLSRNWLFMSFKKCQGCQSSWPLKLASRCSTTTNEPTGIVLCRFEGGSVSNCIVWIELVVLHPTFHTSHKPFSNASPIAAVHSSSSKIKLSSLCLHSWFWSNSLSKIFMVWGCLFRYF